MPAAVTTQQINVHSVVNSAQIRREQHNGQEHIVIPSYTLPSNVVMNGGLYPAAEIDAHYHKLEGTLAPLGHPVVNNKHVSALSPEAVTNPNVNIGAFNRNVKKVGHRIYSEKWINVNMASGSEQGRRLIERVAAFERNDPDAKPIHTSVALFVNREEVDSTTNTGGYSWIAHIKDIDHDAILLDEPGAATPEQGVGLMVNSATATAITVNSGVLIGDSYGDKSRRLESAAKDRWGQGENEYVWVADFTDTQAIIVRNGGNGEVFGYKIESGKVVFDETGSPVERRESWFLKINQTIGRFANAFFNQSPVNPAVTGESEMPMTDAEKKDLADIAANAAKAAVAEALKPLQDAVTAQGVTLATISANADSAAKAAADEKRKVVAASMGDVVANALSGEALDKVHAEVIAKQSTAPAGSAAALAANSGGTSTAGKFVDNMPD